jgi:hypothetical protein
MLAALLVALAATQTTPTTPAVTMDGISSLGNPNYTQSSVHVGSVNNPMYSFPSGVDEHVTVNGRLYRGVPIIGGLDVGPKNDLARAAAEYGAADQADLRVQSDVEGLFRYHPTTTVEFSPWTTVMTQKNSPASDPFSRAHEKVSRRAEEARQQWLKDNNYVGGVRSFVNDAELYAVPAEPKKTQLPEPRGVIELSPEVPAFRSRMHVMVTVHTPPAMKTAELIKVVPAQIKPEAKPDAKAETAVAKADEKPAEKMATVAK